MNVVDSSGWIEHFQSSHRAAFFSAALSDKAQLLVPSIAVYEVHRRLSAWLPANLMTECVFHITRIAHANPYIRGLVDSLDDMSRWAHSSSLGHKQIRELWGKFLMSAASKGEISKELPLDDVISWLILSQDMLLTKVQAIEVSDDDLRLFIRRFVVKPLLPDK